MKKGKRILSCLLAVCMLAGLVPANVYAAGTDTASAGFGRNFMMQVNDSGYLATQGLNVFLYNTQFDQTFGDQKCAGMEMVLHGQRVATDGDIRLMPTPEQWDAVPRLVKRSADKDTNTLTAQMTYADYDFNYTLKVTPEAGGFKVSVNLDNPLPETLAGRAGFNLEFMPALYKGKTYQIDGQNVGVLPISPENDMVSMAVPADDPLTQTDYVKQWTEERGDAQPVAIASGTNITLAPEDEDNRVCVTSDSGDISIYDGRNRAQNGWFVLRTLVPAGKTEDAVVWHIKADVEANWTRDPVVTHSQVGYAPNMPKVAIIELDPNDDAPDTATVQRLNTDGTYTQVYQGPVTGSQNWTRYRYTRFDFSQVKDPGMYAIEYGGQFTDVFPIADGVYSQAWQQTLSGYLAEQMDHMQVRDAYRIWHKAQHMDDARMAPLNLTWFDGWSMGSTTDSPYAVGEHIPGLNVGGWCDAGDFDIQTDRNIGVIQDLAIAYQEFGMDWDTLTVDEANYSTEMHRPDGIPDIVQQVEHGALQIEAQIDSVGFCFPVIEATSLRQYTHLGDASSDTDGRIYKAGLGTEEYANGFSGKEDDRWAFIGTKSDSRDLNAAASLAAAAAVLKGWDDAKAEQFLNTAIAIWNRTPHTGTGSGWGAVSDWSAAIELLIATDGGEAYKTRVEEQFSSQMGSLGSNGWKAVRVLKYLDPSYTEQMKTAVQDYVKTLDGQVASNPYGVPSTTGMWGGTTNVCDMGERMFFLYKAFPEIVSSDYTMRVANYMLGTHPVSSTSYVSGVGTVSKMKAYGNNRANDTYISGGVVPGYVVISPDFPESLDNFGMLWFESEYVIDTAAKWIIVANAADEITSNYTDLEDLTVNGTTVEGFDKSVISYNVSLPYSKEGTEVTVGATPSTSDATVSFSGDCDANGTVNVQYGDTKTVSVTVTEGSKQAAYKVTLTMADESVYAETIQVNGKTVEGFDPQKTDYSVDMDELGVTSPSDLTVSATVPADKTDAWTVKVTPPTSLPGNYKVDVTSSGGAKTYTIKVLGKLQNINFLDPAESSKFSIEAQDVSEIKEGQGLYMTSTTDCFEPAKQGKTGIKDAAIIPAKGDWTATLKFKFSTGGSQGFYEFFGFYGMDDYNNFAGIRGGNGAIQDCIRKDGAITEETQSTASGLAAAEYHWFRIVKTGDSYDCYWSIDGVTFDKTFSYSGTGITGDQIIIDAYSGMLTGYTYYLEYLYSGTDNTAMHQYGVDNALSAIVKQIPSTLTLGEGENTYQLPTSLNDYQVTYETTDENVANGLISTTTEARTITVKATVSDGTATATSQDITISVPAATVAAAAQTEPAVETTPSGDSAVNAAASTEAAAATPVTLSETTTDAEAPQTAEAPAQTPASAPADETAVAEVPGEDAAITETSLIAGAAEDIPDGTVTPVDAQSVYDTSFGKNFMMKVNDSGYLATQGLNVILYNTQFDQTFGDQKCSAMEMVLNGQRVATDGDIRLMPTPEQWDAVSKLISKNADKDTDTLTADLTYADYNLNYTLKVEPEAGGYRVSVNLENPLPDVLVGRAGFSLEFIPSVFKGKSYQVDGEKFGTLPISPESAMVNMPIPSDDPLTEKAYVTQWKADRGDAQPVPIVSGGSIVLAAEDDNNRISVTSDQGLALYDGRNRAQNGWFVLRSTIPAGKTTDAVVWHVKADVNDNWTREPVVTHSQVGYEPNLTKTAVIELDPNYSAPKTAELDRLNADGSYTQVYTGDITGSKDWTRYNYKYFDFSSVTEPGMYAIKYAGKMTDLFPIKTGVYSDTWQATLSGYLAEQMDHMEVREGYRIWHSASHMDDALQAPLNLDWFDGWSMGSSTDSPYAPGEHIEGLNVGGWCDAGDFDIQTSRNLGVIQDLALAYEVFGLDWDTLDVNEDTKQTEMHRPDGVPDIIQQIEHGVLQILAQLDTVGYCFPVIEAVSLRQYTHLGDGGSDTDGRVYSRSLTPGSTITDTSDKNDDRWAFAGVKSASMQFSAAAALASASGALKGYDDELATKCLDTAKKLWDAEDHTAQPDFWTGSGEWSAAVQLLVATKGGQSYKDRLQALFASQMAESSFGRNGWKAVRTLEYLDKEYQDQFKEAVGKYVTYLDNQLSSNPYGVNTTMGMWGGTTNVCDLGERMYMLHLTYPDLVSSDYTLRVANYILGTHPDNSTSYLSGVGTVSKTKAYGNNRADDTYIAGGIVPGYVVISPDLPECRDDFGMMWFESEYVIDTAAKWIFVANAADTLSNEPVADTHSVTVTTNKDGAAWSSGKTFTLQSGTSQPVGLTGVADGTYQLLADGVDTGKTVTVKGADAKITLDYFTVTFKATDVSPASGSKITATYGGSPVKSGDVVLGGQTLVLAATGAGASSYTYAWTGDNASGTGATLTIPNLSGKVNATCTVTGSTTPPPSSGGNTSSNYTLKFETNGGNSIASVSGGSGKQIDLSQYQPTKAGNTFLGWFTSAAAADAATSTGKVDGAVTSVKLTGNMTVYAAWKGLTNDHVAFLQGYADGTFKPDKNMTRAEAAVMFYRLLENQTLSVQVSFSDVANNAWYGQAVKVLAGQGIIQGYADGSFKPYAPITRAQFATIASRFENLTTGTTTFSDVPSSYWAYRYINSAAAKGWITGYNDGTFRPDQFVTRAQVATMVNRVLDRKLDTAFASKNLASMKTFSDVPASYWAYADIGECANAHDYMRATATSNETWISLK